MLGFMAGIVAGGPVGDLVWRNWPTLLYPGVIPFPNIGVILRDSQSRRIWRPALKVRRPSLMFFVILKRSLVILSGVNELACECVHVVERPVVPFAIDASGGA